MPCKLFDQILEGKSLFTHFDGFGYGYTVKFGILCPKMEINSTTVGPVALVKAIGYSADPLSSAEALKRLNPSEVKTFVRAYITQKQNGVKGL